jgi:predicted MFS family arabinose efflux permease
MGTYQALYAIGMLTGPAVSGAIADSAGIEWVFWSSAAITVFGAGLVFVRRLPQV